MAKVYLETSFISACVTDREDPASIYRRQTSLEWWDTQRGKHTVFACAEVTRELSHPDYRHGEAALALLSEVPLLGIGEEVVGLARILVREKVMPGPIAGDAVHVAVAAAHRIDYLLTWNVRHLANPNKLEHLRGVCRRVGLVPPQMVTPDLLWEDEA